MKEERFLYPGNCLQQLGDQPRQTGPSGGSEKSTAAGLWLAEPRRTSTDGPDHLTALPSPRCESSAGVHRGLVLKLDFSGLPWGKDWGWLPRDSLQHGPGLKQRCAKAGGWPAISPTQQPHSHSRVLTAGVAPPPRGLAVCKCLWAAHMWRWG